MELKSTDVYRVECSAFISADLIRSLFSLYQPILGIQATNLYMTLYSISLSQTSQESHARLLSLMNIGIEELERSRIRLEEYLLLRTYAQEQESRTSYIYVLNPPLSVQGFFNQKELMAILANALGEKGMEQTVNRIQTGTISTQDYKDVTRAVSHARKAKNYDTSVEYTQIEKRYNFTEHATDIHFDYERFLTITSTLVFPAELRTQENMQMIGELATVYGLSADRMQILVMRCVNINKMVFDVEKLKLLCQKSQPDTKQGKYPYSMSPVSFLQAKQNGAPVSVTDRKILENLAVNMKFSPEVINVMVEYILNISQNRLVKSFVDMVAGEWARDGVTTREQAIAETKKVLSKTTTTRSKKEMPAYFEKLENQTYEKASEEELKELKKKMEKKS